MYKHAVVYAVPVITGRVVPTPLSTGPPRARALNVTATCGDVSVTLLSLDDVGDLLRLTGVLRLVDRPGIQVVTTPSLEVTMPDGTPLSMVDAHVMPHGQMAWLSWTYERPAILPPRLIASITSLQFEYRAGGTRRLDLPGPWGFAFNVEPADRRAGPVGPGGGIGRA